MSCICGYTSVKPATVRRHQRTCKAHALSLNGTLDEITSLKVSHLEEKVKLLQDQLVTKDQQIEQLIKRPRTVNNTTNNRYVVEQHVWQGVPRAHPSGADRGPSGGPSERSVEVHQAEAPEGTWRCECECASAEPEASDLPGGSGWGWRGGAEDASFLLHLE